MKTGIALGCLLLVALGLRLTGMSFGIYHADEPIVVNHALQYATGDLNPHFFKIPPLVSYLCFLVYGAWFVVGKMTGAFLSAASFQTLFVDYPEIFYWVGRIALGVIPGTITVWAVWSTLRRIAGDRAAIWSALAVTVNFLHVRDSHAIYTDILMTLLVWGSVDAALRFMRTPTVFCAAWAGLFVGAATAAKYNALLAGIAVLMAWLLVSRKISTAAAVAGGTVGAFALLNPFAILDFKTFWGEILAQAGAEGPSSVGHILGYSLAESCGWGLLVVAALGAAVIFIKRTDRHVACVLFSFPILFFVKLLFFSQPHERYVLPMIPFVAAAFGLGVNAVFLLMERKGKGMVISAACVMASMLIFGTVKSVAADVFFLRADTRDQAGAWIRKNVRPGSKIAFSDTRHRPRLFRDRAQWEASPDKIGINAKTRMEYEASASRPGYWLFFIEERALPSFAGVWEPVGPSIEELRRAGVEYVIIHYGTEADASWRGQLKSGARMVGRFSPYADADRTRPLETDSVTFAAYEWHELMSRTRFGPVLEIYQL